MTAPATGAAVALVLAALSAFRYRHLRPALDARARRAWRAKTGAFLAAAALASAGLAAAGGRLAWPWTWTLLLVWLGLAGWIRIARGR